MGTDYSSDLTCEITVSLQRFRGRMCTLSCCIFSLTSAMRILEKLHILNVIVGEYKISEAHRSVEINELPCEYNEICTICWVNI